MLTSLTSPGAASIASGEITVDSSNYLQHLVTSPDSGTVDAVHQLKLS